MQDTVARSINKPDRLIYRPASWVELLSLPELFAQPQPLEVELGSGDGSFLAQWARANPNCNFIGVERLLGRLRKVERKGRRLGLRNLRLLRIEAGYFLEFLLPPASVEALHVYFPDPWPKRKHRKNRLVQQRFTELTARALAPAGIVYLRTDDPDYFAQIQQVFATNGKFKAVATPPELSGVLTDFEKSFTERHIQTNRAAWQLDWQPVKCR